MALLTINGTAIGGTSPNIAAPVDFQVTINDISKADRNALGNMVIERINTKRTLAVSWTYLSQTDTSNLLKAVSSTSFSVTYPDPQTGTNLTSTFYVGDRSLGMIDFTNGIPRYKDIKFTLIEL